MVSVQIEMPKYRCHKEVWALKIEEIVENKTNEYLVTLKFEDKRYGGLSIDPDWYFKHKPEVGGYYVVYKDGYSSFSPAKAFEDGYTLIIN